ncbi:MAG: FadR/GntR family transcriptional regulator [Oscillospiraceae bacterium]
MSEQKKVKRSEQAANRLYEMIIEEGQYTAGSKLPNENELSLALDVSRTTLREAISVLVAQGILEIQRGKGTFVVQNLPTVTADFSSVHPAHNKNRVKDLFEMRLIFEPETAALACVRATDEELRQIQQQALWVDETAQKGGNWAEEDQTLHLAITKASHNEYMRRLYPIISSAVNEILAISANRKMMENLALADNRQILDFLMRRDAEGARLAMTIHLKHIINTLQC